MLRSFKRQLCDNAEVVIMIIMIVIMIIITPFKSQAHLALQFGMIGTNEKKSQQRKSNVGF